MSEELSPEEARVVGSLIEKQLATPQYYPLTLNALVNACNQSNNRTPVVTYDEATVERAMAALREKGFARLVHPGGGSRVTKFRHVVDEALGLDARELALICVMLLRGPQTLNELRTRTERMADFGAGELEHDLERLIGREPALAINIGRRPGQREERFATTLTAIAEEAGAGLDAAPSSSSKRGASLFGDWQAFAGRLDESQVPARLRTLAALRTAHLCASSVLWDHYAGGVDDGDLARLTAGLGDWDGVEGLVLTACDEVNAVAAVGESTRSSLAGVLGDDGVVELLFLLGHYRTLAVVTSSAS